MKPSAGNGEGSHVFNLEATIHHHLQAIPLSKRCGLMMDNSLLHPDALGAYDNGIFNYWKDIFGTPEDIDHVNRLSNLCQA